MKKAVCMVLMAMSLSGCINNGNGEKIGMVTKLAKQGLVFKTWEGEIVRGGLSGGSGVNGQAFAFTIEDPEVVKQVQSAMEHQQEIKITYESELFHFFRSESHGHFLVKIEPINNTALQGTAKVSTGRDNNLIEQLLKVQAQLIEQLAK